MTNLKVTLVEVKEEKEKMAELIEECELESKVSCMISVQKKVKFIC